MFREWDHKQGGKARSNEKRKKIYFWLSNFHYSNIELMSGYLGVDYKGQRAFFNKMVKDGFLHKFPSPVSRSQLYMMTTLGREEARAITEKAINYSTVQGTVKASRVLHNLSMQKALINRLDKFSEFTTDRHIDLGKNTKAPDIIIVGIKNKKRIALEIELTYKADARIYFAFKQHTKQLESGLYDAVEYVFANSGIKENYEKKFKQEHWKNYLPDARHRLMVDKKYKFFTNSKSKFFRFSVEELIQ